MTEQYSQPCILYCSFCGVFHEELEFLIAGPGVSICSECVETCNDLIAERK